MNRERNPIEKRERNPIVCDGGAPADIATPCAPAFRRAAPLKWQPRGVTKHQQILGNEASIEQDDSKAVHPLVFPRT